MFHLMKMENSWKRKKQFGLPESVINIWEGEYEMNEKKVTGYPSVDKPWLKYYTEEAINAQLPECTI